MLAKLAPNWPTILTSRYATAILLIINLKNTFIISPLILLNLIVGSLSLSSMSLYCNNLIEDTNFVALRPYTLFLS